MTGASNIKLTIHFVDPALDLEEREAEAQQLFSQLKQAEEVETVERVLDPDPPAGNKALGGMLMALLTAEVNAANVKALLGFLGERLYGKPITLEVEANGKKLKVTANSHEELEALIASAQKFVAV